MLARIAAGLLAGVVFGFGLALAGMTDPNKALAFLDVAGAWDPSLLLVLGAAVLVTLIGFRVVLRRPRPLFDERFHLPQREAIDRALVGGSVLFGIGWGIGGYCPGPAIALLAAPGREALVFLPGLIVGILLNRAWQRLWQPRVTT
jgi:uncharacterized membrane protein YedE/YeeE